MPITAKPAVALAVNPSGRPPVAARFLVEAPVALPIALISAALGTLPLSERLPPGSSVASKVSVVGIGAGSDTGATGSIDDETGASLEDEDDEFDALLGSDALAGSDATEAAEDDIEGSAISDELTAAGASIDELAEDGADADVNAASDEEAGADAGSDDAAGNSDDIAAGSDDAGALEDDALDGVEDAGCIGSEDAISGATEMTSDASAAALDAAEDDGSGLETGACADGASTDEATGSVDEAGGSLDETGGV